MDPEDTFNSMAAPDLIGECEALTILINEEAVETPVVTSPTVAKENGFVPEFHGSFGESNQPRLKPRVSFLKEFDPLYEKSPIKERLLEEDAESLEEVTLKDEDRTFLNLPGNTTQNLIDVSLYNVPVCQADISDTEAFVTPLTSPQGSLGNTTQGRTFEDPVTSLQQSLIHCVVSPGRDLPNSLEEAIESHISDSNLVSSNEVTVTPHSPSNNFHNISSTEEIAYVDKESSVVNSSVSSASITPVTSPQKNLGNTTQEKSFEDLVTSVQESPSCVSPECESPVVVVEATGSNITDLNLVSSNEVPVNPNSPSSTSNNTATEEPVSLDAESFITNNPVSPSIQSPIASPERSLGNTTQEPSFEDLATSLEQIPNHSDEATEAHINDSNLVPSDEVIIASHLPSSNNSHNNSSIEETVSFDTEPCIINNSAPPVIENPCIKNETASSDVDTKLPPESITVIDPTPVTALHEEVEIHGNSLLSRNTVTTKSAVDVLPINGVDGLALTICNSDTETLKSKMADLNEDLAKQQQENSELRLQLNALQQARATLELEVRQKEEIIIKSQAEALKSEQKFKQEIKMLKEKVKENSTLIEKGGTKHLQEQLKEAQLKEAKCAADLQARIKLEDQHAKEMEEYDITLQHRLNEFEKLKDKFEVNKTHLANLELAFSDVHSKYEKCKENLQASLQNEEALIVKLDLAQATNNQHEERYESLRQHARNQIDKSNKELLSQRERYESEILKLKAIIKRLEIKCSSLEISIQQKIEECEQLANLCDEVTGKKI